MNFIVVILILSLLGGSYGFRRADNHDIQDFSGRVLASQGPGC